MENKPETFITSKTAAQLLGVTKYTIQLWEEKDILRAWKTPGGHRRIAMSSVESLLEQRRKELEGHRSETLRMLVVEDDPDMLAFYRQMIANWEFPVDLFTAENGYDGIIQIGLIRPQVVITDLDMPKMDGLQLVHAIRKHPEFDHIEIVVVTILTPQEIAARNELPANVSIFMKTMPVKELEQAIRKRCVALGTNYARIRS